MSVRLLPRSLFGQILLARRFAPVGYEESFIEDLDPVAIRRMVAVLLIAGTLFLGVIFGSVASGEWQTLLTALHGQPFGRPDAQFGRDLSFYVFTLPALHFVQQWALSLLLVSGLAAGLPLLDAATRFCEVDKYWQPTKMPEITVEPGEACVM